jgi:hypothetical protein
MNLEESNGLTYVTLDLSEATELNFEEIQQTSLETLRISIDGTKTIIKWFTAHGVPSSVESLTTKGSYLTYDEALALMSTEAWTFALPTV